MMLTKSDILTAIILIVVPLAAFFGFFQPHLSYIARLKKEQLSYRAKLWDSETLQSRAFALRTRTAKIRSQLKYHLEQTGGGTETFKAVDAIVQKARENGVKIDIIKPGNTIQGRVLDCLPILVTTTSPFTALHNFLTSIETDTLLITVMSLDISADEANAECKARVELRVHFSPPADRGAKT